jgi:adenylate cyclase
LLNEYLGEMTDIVFQRWGTLDKYIGDAIMAFWGSPYPQDDHFIRACASALDMQARLEELNLRWEVQGRKQLHVGVGINTGRVTVGNMGSTKRLAWTCMGDNVNLASRLEGLTKAYHVRNIISEFTYQKVAEHYVCRDLDRIRVKGKLRPVGIYELLAFKKDEPRYADLVTGFNDAMGAYRRKSWDEAVEKFEAVLSKYPEDGPSEIFWQRAQEFRKEAPAPDWDGVYVMKTK